MDSGRQYYLGQPVAAEVQQIRDMLLDNDFHEPAPVLVPAVMDDRGIAAEVPAEISLFGGAYDFQAQVNLNRVRNSDVLQELHDFNLDFLFDLDPIQVPVPLPSPPVQIPADVDEVREDEDQEPPQKRRKVEEGSSARDDRDDVVDLVIIVEEPNLAGPEGDHFEPEIEVVYEGRARSYGGRIFVSPEASGTLPFEVISLD